MTHEELLAKINNSFKTLWENQPEAISNTKALRAAVELHKPYKKYSEPKYRQLGDPNLLYCFICLDSDKFSVIYPCPTIQAIEKELK